MQHVVQGAVGHVLDDNEFAVVRVGTEPDEVHEPGVSDTGQNLDLVLRRDARGTVTLPQRRRLLRVFRPLDRRDKLPAVENSLVNAAVASFAQEAIGGEPIGGGGEVVVGELPDRDGLVGFGFSEAVGVANRGGGLGIAEEVTHFQVGCLRR